MQSQNIAKGLYILGALVLVLLAFSGAGMAEDLSLAENDRPYVEGQLFVQFDSMEAVFSLDESVVIIEDYSALIPGLLLIETPDGMTVDEAVIYYSSQPGVEYAEPNYIVTLPDEPVVSDPVVAEPVFNQDNNRLLTVSSGVTPNDYFYYLQWGLPDVNLPEAWMYTTGSSDVIVAVIDTGINYNHEDLKGNMWTDSYGHYGYDFVNNDNNPLDDNGHGSHCAGIIGAVGNNGKGISGVAWNVSLMAVKVLNSKGSGTESDIANGILYAINHDADILSMSLGGYGEPSRVFSAAIEAAEGAEILCVCAAGNEENNNDRNPSYPASFTEDNIFSVAATTSSHQLASFSNYGKTSVDLGAPGVSIASAYYDDTDSYIYMDGTSMATPLVAGVAALMLSVNPDLDGEDLKSILMDSVDTYTSLKGKVVTGGIINAKKAVEAAIDEGKVKVTSISISGSSSVNPGDSVQLTATVKPDNAYDRTVTWSSSKPSVATVSQTGLVTGVSGGTATITATANDGSGKKGTFTMNVHSPISIEITGADSCATGSSVDLKATVSGASGKYSVVWSSSDTSVATVSSKGKVTGKKAGEVIIRASIKDDSSVFAEHEMTITPKISKIVVSASSSSISANSGVAELTATVVYSNGAKVDNPDGVVWSSDKTSVASVNQDGVVTAGSKAGSATITASYGGKKGTVKISVVVPVKDVTITSSKGTSVVVGSSLTLKASVSPSGASNKKVTWSSNNTKVATVSSSGSVKGVSAGSVRITATAADGQGASDYIDLVVTPKVSGVTVTSDSAKINKNGGTTQVAAVVKFSDGSSKALSPTEVTWSSSNKRIATVDANGVVTAKSKTGSVTITGTYGGKKGTVKISVV